MPTMPTGIVPVTSPGGYSHGGPGGALRTEVEGGANRYALAFERGPQPFQVTLVCDPSQYQMWSLFYLVVTKKGTITFDMPLDSGNGVQPHAVNIVPGTYQATNTNGSTWIVGFTVEAESRIYDFDDDSAELILDYYNNGESLSELLAALNQFANYDSNVLDF